MNNFLLSLKKCCIGLLLILVSFNLWGWVLGVEPSDSIGDVVIDGADDVVSCSSTADIRTDDTSYRKGGYCILVCHRWDLQWQGVWNNSGDCELDELSVGSWAEVLNAIDQDGIGTTRLPTIKELVRIFDYSNSASGDPALPVGHGKVDGFFNFSTKGNHFRAWLQVENQSTAFVDGYLISSTYRNIAADGGDVGDASPKILGIEIETGKVVAFDQNLNLCTELTSSGACAVDDNSDGDNIDKYDVDVYAFKVSELP